MDRRYVGIDLHRRRSVIYAMGADGEKLFCERIDNDAMQLLEVVSAAGQWCGGFVRESDERYPASSSRRRREPQSGAHDGGR